MTTTSWLSVIKAVFVLLYIVTNALHRRRLLADAEAIIAASILKESQDAIEEARAARAAARTANSSGGLYDDDGFRRDDPVPKGSGDDRP